MLKARAVAFYLPQFHPIPQNDAWWGPGFTEWTNVARARKLFPGHTQPHLPADLGFYDLRLQETRLQQAELAAQYGIEAFCYWHYWFGDGRRILERPFAEVLESGSPGLSFCLGWANESWTGIWHGAGNKTLIEQRYPGREDYRSHFETLLPAFHDSRYLRVDGRPVFLVYKPAQLPNAHQFVKHWQEMAVRSGLGGLYLVANLGAVYSDFRSDGFDAGIWPRLPHRGRPELPLMGKLRRRMLRLPEVHRYTGRPFYSGEEPLPIDLHPVVFPNWDNTPRSGVRGVVITDSTPDKFRLHVRGAVSAMSQRPLEHRLLWVKSWNEWAEGNYIEPDLEVGHDRLEALRSELINEDSQHPAANHLAPPNSVQ